MKILDDKQFAAAKSKGAVKRQPAQDPYLGTLRQVRDALDKLPALLKAPDHTQNVRLVLVAIQHLSKQIEALAAKPAPVQEKRSWTFTIERGQNGKMERVRATED